MRLAELQAALGAELEGRPCAELRALITNVKLAPDECLQLYRDLLCNAQTQTLKHLYPVTGRLLGPDLMRVLASQYAARYRSSTPSQPLGSHFAHLLQNCTTEHAELENLQFLPELARLEWLLYCAWRAADDPPLNFSSLAYIPEEEQYRLRLIPSQAMQLLYCQWPILDIWNNYQQEQPGELRLCKSPGWICVYRQLDAPRAESVSETQARLLKGILGGQTLYQLNRTVTDINQHLTFLIARSWISGFELPPDLAATEDLK